MSADGFLINTCMCPGVPEGGPRQARMQSHSSAQSWLALQHPCFTLRSCFLLLENRALPWKLSLSHGEGADFLGFLHSSLMYQETTALVYQF